MKNPKEVIVLYSPELDFILNKLGVEAYPFVATVSLKDFGDDLDDDECHIGLVIETGDADGCRIYEHEYVPNNKFFRKLYGI